tara:strand:- start:86 stop:577 length:492 start_codon:yes stop_codon:yes gene_type:complete
MILTEKESKQMKKHKMRKLWILDLGDSHPKTTCPNCNTIIDPELEQDNYAKAIIGLLSTPENQQSGANYAEMNKVLPIIKKFQEVSEAIDDGEIEVGNAYVLLTEEQWVKIRDRATKQGFRRISEDIRDMVKAIRDCEEITVKPEESAVAELTTNDDAAEAGN